MKILGLHRRGSLYSVLLSGALCAALPSTAEPQSLEFGPPYSITGGFENPFGVAVDGGRLVVADTRNRRLRWTLTSSLTATPTFTDFGYVANATLPTALISPEGIAADGLGHVYVADARLNEARLYTWDAATSNYVYDPNFASTTRNSVAGTAILSPRDVAVGPGGKVYLLDSGNKRVLTATGFSATSWTVLRTDPLLGNAYGLDVAPDGRLYIADTDNHQVIRYEAAGGRTVFGRFGTGAREFRAPRDVAVDVNSRMYVVDTHNHRLQILDVNGQHLFSLGRAPGMGAIQKVAIGSDRHVYIADGDRDAIIAFLGKDAPVPFNGWLRDYLGDTGAEPSDPSFTLGSPDILVRHAADVDIAAAQTAGLQSIAFEHPRFDQDNYVYVTVRNKGTQTLYDAVAKLYWMDPAGTLVFPGEWKDSGFFLGPTAVSAGNGLLAPPVPAGGSTIVGPLRWRPPAPEPAGLGNGTYTVGLRIVHPYDVAPAGAGLAAVRESNNVALRSVHVVRGPFPTGNQNLLAVRARYADDATPIPEGTVTSRVGSLATWASEVSWSTATVDALYRGEITLPETRAYYQDPSRSKLVEMAHDTLDILLTAEPTLLDGVSPLPGDDIGRVIIVTNDTGPDTDWATTGNWPYHLPSGDRYLTVSVQGMNDATPAYEHGFGHQLGLLDLYAYPNVSFPRPFANGWDAMAKPFTGVHPTTWLKERATWIIEHNAKVHFVPRPARGTTFSTGTSPLPLEYQAMAAAGQPVAVAIGLTEGVGTFTDETAFYYLEARSPTMGAADAALPGSGVLMYYVNTQIPQGQGPIILRDHGTSTPGLADAAIPAGGIESPAGTGITATVKSGPAGGPPFVIDLTYMPPLTGYDVSIKTGDPAWTSPDIWVDNQSDGYDVESGRVPTDNGDVAIGKEENRIYARVHNTGPADAFDIEVAFFISEPYHTVGGEADFTFLKSVVIPRHQPGDTTVFVTWTPTVNDPHTCVKVVLRRLLDDTNSANNSAQQNLSVLWSTTTSPFTPVNFSFQVTNPASVPQLVYFRADQVPAGWTSQLVPEKAYLAPGQKFVGALVVTPPPDAPNCTRHDVFVTAWTPSSHTLVRLGGTTVAVNLAKLSGLTFTAETLACTEENFKRALEWQRPEGMRGGDQRDVIGKSALRWGPQAAPAGAPWADLQCIVIHPKGCTDPVQANTEIVIRYLDPDGKPVYHTVKTDANGCFDDFFVATSGGAWDVVANLPAGNCLSPINVGEIVTITIPTGETGTIPGPTLGSAERITPVNYRARGTLRLLAKGATRCVECRIAAMEHDLQSPLTPIGPGAAGTLSAPRLRTVFGDSSLVNGLHEGEATVRLSDGTIVEGAMHGVTNATAHAAPGGGAVIGLEGQFIGRVVSGDRRGCRLVAQYALRSSSDPARGSARLDGLTDGVWECACGTQGTTAVNGVDPLPDGCVFPLSAAGKGKLAQTERRHAECEGAASVVTQQVAGVATLPPRSPTVAPAAPYADAATLQVDSMVLLYESFAGGVAVHGAPFVLVGKGGERIQGQLHGLTHVDPHRTAAAPTKSHHFEGILRGSVDSGPLLGCQLRGVYSLVYAAVTTLAATPVGWSITGAIVCPCAKRDSARPAALPTRPSAPTEPASQTPSLEQDAIAARAQVDRELTARFGRASDLPPADRSLADIDGDGCVTPGEVAAVRLAREDFARADTNHDGSLSGEEFTANYVALIPERLLKGLDRDGNGEIDSTEAGALLPLSRQAADTNFDGRLSVSELAEWARVSARAEFPRLDLDRNGTLSFAEYYGRRSPGKRSQ
ncbi:MAG: hypothetical protein AABO58_12720 [Acidobacteriota bacterium]